MTLVISDNAFGADVDLIVLAEIFGFFLWMLEAELFNEALIWFLSLAGVGIYLHRIAVEARADTTELINVLLVVNVICKTEMRHELTEWNGFNKT